MPEICTRPGCEIQHDGRGYCPTCTAEIKQNLAEQRLAQGAAAPCSCSPGACHGGHTTRIRLDGEKRALPFHPTWELEYLTEEKTDA